MDYKDLANLIFPNAKEISYYEEKYPERNLPEGAIVTRFAPSPTGFVHIGGIYQSLIAKLMAKKDGVFFVRIEDTDQKREVEDAVELIMTTLKQYDITPDVLSQLFNENKIFLETIKIIVDNNMESIKAGFLETIFRDNNLILIIENYCMLNNIKNN